MKPGMLLPTLTEPNGIYPQQAGTNWKVNRLTTNCAEPYIMRVPTYVTLQRFLVKPGDDTTKWLASTDSSLAEQGMTWHNWVLKGDTAWFIDEAILRYCMQGGDCGNNQAGKGLTLLKPGTLQLK
jgi:hypothetical protein